MAPVSVRRRQRAGTGEVRSSALRTIAPDGRRVRSRHYGIASAGADVVRARRNPRSDGEPLATLVAATLKQCSAGARAHPPTESVSAGALALLWLVGPLHLAMEHSCPRQEVAPRKSLCRQMRTSLARSRWRSRDPLLACPNDPRAPDEGSPAGRSKRLPK